MRVASTHGQGCDGLRTSQAERWSAGREECGQQTDAGSQNDDVPTRRHDCSRDRQAKHDRRSPSGDWQTVAGDGDAERDTDRRAGGSEKQAFLQELDEDDDPSQPDGTEEPDFPGAGFEDRAEPAVTNDESRQHGEEAEGRDHGLEAGDGLPNDLLA